MWTYVQYNMYIGIQFQMTPTIMYIKQAETCDVRNMCTHHHTSHIKCGMAATAVVSSVTEVNLSPGRLCRGGKTAWYQLFADVPNFPFTLWKI